MSIDECTKPSSRDAIDRNKWRHIAGAYLVIDSIANHDCSVKSKRPRRRIAYSTTSEFLEVREPRIEKRLILNGNRYQIATTADRRHIIFIFFLTTSTGRG